MTGPIENSFLIGFVFKSFLWNVLRQLAATGWTQAKVYFAHFVNLFHCHHCPGKMCYIQQYLDALQSLSKACLTKGFPWFLGRQISIGCFIPVRSLDQSVLLVGQMRSAVFVAGVRKDSAGHLLTLREAWKSCFTLNWHSGVLLNLFQVKKTRDTALSKLFCAKIGECLGNFFPKAQLQFSRHAAPADSCRL